VFDLAAYFERIGASGQPDVAEIHRSHVAAVPFENLDPHRGLPISLEPTALFDKLVTRGRGGYCFEHNLLLAAALEELGARVEPMLARVRLGASPGDVRPRSHLVLKVHTDDGAYQADVGFGAGTLIEPIPFGPDGIHEQGGWRFRVVEDREELVLQTEDGEVWRDLYGFRPEPVPRVDIETSNWFTCTHPRSPFVTGLIASIQDAHGKRTLLSDWDELTLTEHTAGTAPAITAIDRDTVPDLLESRFGLPGFTLNAEGRVVAAPAQ
jgi:N-hydroxyarylamine O-acetyltransferase